MKLYHIGIAFILRYLHFLILFMKQFWFRLSNFLSERKCGWLYKNISIKDTINTIYYINYYDMTRKVIETVIMKQQPYLTISHCLGERELTKLNQEAFYRMLSGEFLHNPVD